MSKLNFSQIFNPAEIRILKKLSSPQKIQDFLDKMPVNFEPQGDTCLSPRQVLKQRHAHCAEGAMLAAIALWYHGWPPLLMDLKTSAKDYDHVLALFRKNGYWGAISKTNHAVLRYRDPVYKTLRELALSYFHEYFNDDGQKTLRSYSRPFNLSKIKNKSWLTSSDDIWEIIAALDSSKHYKLLGSKQLKNLRKPGKLEIKVGKLTEWKPKSSR